MNNQTNTGQHLIAMFNLLFDFYGPQYWWPAESNLEVMIGAILTQNTNWKNVNKAINNLKQKKWLSFEKLDSVGTAELAQQIRPAGYYNIKTHRLKNLVALIKNHYHGDLSALLADETQNLREVLLSVNGIGPETADSILLYAANRPVFVVDAYTFRILNRHGMTEDQSTYQELQALFMENLPEDPELFNEFHALIVSTGKDFCKKNPLCHKCPLELWGPNKPHF